MPEGRTVGGRGVVAALLALAAVARAGDVEVAAEPAVLSPEAAGRVHRLRDYATGGEQPGDIADPYSGDVEAYRRTLSELREWVERSLERWLAQAPPKRAR